MVTTRNRGVLLGIVALLLASAAVASALAAQRGSEKLGRNLCETTGGAKIVPIPGFPGERIDRRLLDDIELLQRRYKIFINDGYSNDPVHAANGEHPMGLALDIVPNKSAGGSWRDINRLAELAEPEQDAPVAPFRWVGYNGDSGHGVRNHLHLSWNHSEARAGSSPRTVYTLRCPGSGTTGEPTPTPTGGKDGKGDDGKKGGGNGPSGGVEPTGGNGSTTGGIGVSRAAPADPNAPVVEADGVGLGD